MSNTGDDVKILVKTELQDDYNVQAPLGISGDPNSCLALSTDKHGQLNIFYINAGKVMNAYQALKADGNAAHIWTVEDTGFPNDVVPQYIRSMLLPSGHDYVVVLGNDSNIYTMTTSSRFPIWLLLKKTHSSLQPSTISPFITNDGTILIASLMSDGSLYVINPVKGFWTKDAGVGIASSSVSDFQAAAVFGGLRDDSTFGFLLSGNVLDDNNSFSPGIDIASSLKKIPTVRHIISGTYDSLSYVPIGNSTSTPLLFAIDQYRHATYFQADETATAGYTAVYPFGTTTKFTRLEATIRKGSSVDDNQTTIWIDIIAMDTAGHLWHVESAPSADTPPSPSLVIPSIVELSNGEFAVPKWRSPAIISAAGLVTGFALSDSDREFPYLVTTSTSAQSTVLTLLVQDPVTSDWTTTRLAESSFEIGDVVCRPVYYVEVTCWDQNNIRMPGLSAIISSMEYVEVDINGITTTLDARRSHSTITNSQGNVCITSPVDNGFGCPTFTLWIEGMNAEHRCDVQPSGNIQEKLSKITSDDLKNARDQTDHSLVFGDVSDADLKSLSTSLNTTMQAFSAGSPDSTTALSRMYMHPKTPGAVACTRLRRNRSLGFVHPARNPVSMHVTFRPNFDTRILSSEEAQKLIAGMKLDFPSFDISWGDLWESVKNGASTVISIVVDTANQALNAAIKFKDVIGDEFEHVWTGAVTFVKQGLDVVAGLFDAVKRDFGKLFNWLAYIFNWGDIKKTATAFRQKITKFIDNGKDFVDVQLPSLIDPFFDNAKAYIEDHFDSVVNATSALPLNTGSSTSHDLLESLPSSGTWLLNKVLNAFRSLGGVALSGSSGLETLSQAFQTFTKKLMDTGISDDFKNALESVKVFFMSLNSQSIIEGQSIGKLLSVMKNVFVLLIDFTKALVDTALSLVSEALSIILTVLDTTIDIPILSTIFRALGWKDFTLWTLICTPLAIPFTILYKIITGEAPFQTKDEAGLYVIHAVTPISTKSLEDYITLSQGIIAGIFVLIDGPLDVENMFIYKYSLSGMPSYMYPLNTFLNACAVFVPMLQTALNVYPFATSLDSPAFPRNAIGFTISLLFICYNTAITYQSAFRCTPRVIPPEYQPVGITIIGGFGQLIPPFIHACNMLVVGSEPWNKSTGASLVGEFLLPLSCMSKSLILVKDPDGITFVVQLCCDIVAALGAGSAWVLSWEYAK